MDCQHISGTMIPLQDKDGKYIKPQFMICNECNAITLPPTQYSRGRMN